eukprot:12908069-Prorocentrum_lima.AAC.1
MMLPNCKFNKFHAVSLLFSTLSFNAFLVVVVACATVEPRLARKEGLSDTSWNSMSSIESQGGADLAGH